MDVDENLKLAIKETGKWARKCGYRDAYIDAVFHWVRTNIVFQPGSKEESSFRELKKLGEKLLEKD